LPPPRHPRLRLLPGEPAARALPPRGHPVGDRLRGAPPAALAAAPGGTLRRRMRRAITPVERRRLIALGAALAGLVAVVVVVVVLVAGGGSEPPATGAARLVPADALAYVHVSTDRDREGVQQAMKLLNRFP